MTRVQLRCTGSFRLDAGIRRLHRNHKFAEPLAKTVALSFHHSCRSELTRQGISLDAVTTSRDSLREAGRTFLSSSACRHAVRTISSPAIVNLRTVIVTAAVHRGFSSSLRPCGLSPCFNLPAPGRCHPLYVVFDFAESCVFVKQLQSAIHCDRFGL